MTIGENNSRLLHEQGLTELRLRNCLSPEPFHIRDDKKHIELAVIDNCEPTVQAKIFAQRAGALEIDKPKMDAAGFYDQLASGEMQQAVQLSA
ncbi:VC2046/SO_2500 family protein [Pseudoalteromonas phenolica]|nr:VC2046/SO_2500 family protein [Pseudoalteromonas phenolica]